MPYLQTGLEDPSLRIILWEMGVNSEKREDVLDICELAPESRTKDGLELATQATLPELAKVAVEETGRTVFKA